MKVKYMGPFGHAEVSVIGKVVRGQDYEVSEETGKMLLSTGQFKKVREPKIKKEDKTDG